MTHPTEQAELKPIEGTNKKLEAVKLAVGYHHELGYPATCSINVILTDASMRPITLLGGEDARLFFQAFQKGRTPAQPAEGWRPIETAWTVQTKEGRLSTVYISPSKSDLERRIVGTHYDAGALRNNHTYRELFEDELKEALERSGDTIVKVWIGLPAAPSGERGVE